MGLLKGLGEVIGKDPNKADREGTRQADGKRVAKGISLEEKFFRRVERFSGDPKGYRHWLFELLVAIGQVDKGLARDLNTILSRDRERGEVERWVIEDEVDIDEDRFHQYSGELYGVLVSLTSGEARNILRGMADKGEAYNGYKGLLLLNKRFDSKTTASLLSVLSGCG